MGCPGDETLDSPNFDLVNLINAVFSTEQSLSNIADVIVKAGSVIRKPDADVRGTR